VYFDFISLCLSLNLVVKFYSCIFEFNNMCFKLNWVNIPIEIWIRDIRFVFALKISISIFEVKLKYSKRWYQNLIPCGSNLFPSSHLAAPLQYWEVHCRTRLPLWICNLRFFSSLKKFYLGVLKFDWIGSLITIKFMSNFILELLTSNIITKEKHVWKVLV
jgi:hypothetical protein